MSWYDGLDENIREVVRVLRDNGINTTASCGHEMWVEAECYSDEDVYRAHDCLYDNGYHCKITEGWTLSTMAMNQRYMYIGNIKRRDVNGPSQ